jgi:hypothetical protein
MPTPIQDEPESTIGRKPGELVGRAQVEPDEAPPERASVPPWKRAHEDEGPPGRERDERRAPPRWPGIAD